MPHICVHSTGEALTLLGSEIEHFTFSFSGNNLPIREGRLSKLFHTCLIFFSAVQMSNIKSRTKKQTFYVFFLCLTNSISINYDLYAHWS